MWTTYSSGGRDTNCQATVRLFQNGHYKSCPKLLLTQHRPVFFNSSLRCLLQILTVCILFSDGYHGRHHGTLQHRHDFKEDRVTFRRSRRQEPSSGWSPSQELSRRRSKGGITRGKAAEPPSDWVFISKNATTVRAHIGSMANLPCSVRKDSLYGMVSTFCKEGNRISQSFASAILKNGLFSMFVIVVFRKKSGKMHVDICIFCARFITRLSHYRVCCLHVLENMIYVPRDQTWTSCIWKCLLINHP